MTALIMETSEYENSIPHRAIEKTAFFLSGFIYLFLFQVRKSTTMIVLFCFYFISYSFALIFEFTSFPPFYLWYGFYTFIAVTHNYTYIYVVTFYN